MSVYLNKHTTEVYKYAVKRAENRAKVSKLSSHPYSAVSTEKRYRVQLQT